MKYHSRFHTPNLFVNNTVEIDKTVMVKAVNKKRLSELNTKSFEELNDSSSKRIQIKSIPTIMHSKHGKSVLTVVSLSKIGLFILLSAT